MIQEHQEGEIDGRNQRADARRTRERILASARLLLDEMRIQQVSMEDVARAAAIGKVTVYRHFPTRESLFAALIHDGAERVVAALHERIPPEADAPTKLSALITILYDNYEDHHINVELMLAAHDLPATHLDSGHDPVAEIFERVRGILAQGVREGSFRDLDLEYTTFFVLGALNPLAFVKHRERLGYTRTRLEQHAADLLLHALIAPPTQ